MLTYNDKLQACKDLDVLGFTRINAMDIEPYAIRFDIKASSDCDNARKYYSDYMDCNGFEMHHTANGYIVPVATNIHKRVKHIGGVALYKLDRQL